MNQISSPIPALPKPLNGFIFHRDRGVVSSALSQDLPAKDLTGIGRILSRLYTLVSAEPVMDIRLAFDTVCVTVRQIDEEVFAVIISAPSMGEAEVVAHMDRHLPAFLKGKPRSSAPAGAIQVPGPEYIEEQLHSGPVAAQLQSLSTRLFQSAGPVARVIFRDALRQWLGSGPPSPGRLEDLVRILMQEIRDTEKAQNFRAGLPRDLTTWEI